MRRSGMPLHRVIKPILFVALGWPAASFAIDYLQGEEFSPWRTLLQDSGLYAMRFIVLGLAVTPLRVLTGWSWVQGLRRMIGLYAAFYTALHVFAWCRQYDYDWGFLLDELVQRFYLLVGLIATVAMVPLTATSFDAAMRALGGVAWRKLHRLVFPAALLAWWHYLLSRGLPPREVYADAILLTILIALRILLAWRRANPAIVASRSQP
jgi:sulfoxide reductase heme-binding subunit YedZ